MRDLVSDFRRPRVRKIGEKDLLPRLKREEG
ncbi:hypothetical protein PEP31012_03312 [Pandoraea eparura]|uniref:Uncharacterized protein n=1 Tax=Pandoraea eparura TaxID=2508291 RepID=A0A5E4WGG6_9BURK|nr:hypothetical protein PEP31012_03312 [Pandoraea eparura]